MAISFPTTPPSTPAPKRIRPAATNIVAGSVSPFTGQQQLYLHQGEFLAFDVELPAMLRDDAEEWLAWLLSMRGRYGTCLFGDASGRVPRGSALGTPVVNGGGQSGIVLNTDGWMANSAGVLLPGDYIQLGTGASSRLHKVLTTVSSDLYGNALVDIWPRLRESPADADPITLTNTKGRFRLAGNVASWDIDIIIYGVTFQLVEAI